MNLQVLIGIISATVGILVTLGTIIWKVSQLASKITINEVQIKDLKERFDDFEDKLDVKFEEINAQNNTICTTLARIEERMNLHYNRRKNDTN